MRFFSRPHPRVTPEYDMPVSARSAEQIFSGCSDFEIREIFPGGERAGGVWVCYLDGVVSGGDVSLNIIRPLTDEARLGGVKSGREMIKQILGGVIYSYSVKERETADDLVNDLVNGFCAIIFDREGKALTFECRSGEKRSVGEPTLEKSVKGAKDAFVETLRVNTSLVRRKIRDPRLKIESSIVGRRTKTSVAVVFVEDIANPELPKELTRRLDEIDIDGVLCTGNIEEYIVDCPKSPFPQMLMTERSDRFCLNLLDGRVGLIIDGIPLGFMLPGTLPKMFKVPEDNAVHPLAASLLTFMRWFCAALSLLFPAVFVAISMYHQEMYPMQLLLSVVEAKQKVPFSVAGEVLGMLLAFELLQEAGLRLPNPVGETVSIIGGLIVGQSAVAASIVSPITVIVVALSGIAGYTLPNNDLSIAFRLCRFGMVIAAIAAGFFGVLAAAVMLVYHLCCIESFGVPYTEPLTGGGLTGLVRSLFRAPLPSQKERDAQLNPQNIRRQK